MKFWWDALDEDTFNHTRFRARIPYSNTCPWGYPWSNNTRSNGIHLGTFYANIQPLGTSSTYQGTTIGQGSCAIFRYCILWDSFVLNAFTIWLTLASHVASDQGRYAVPKLCVHSWRILTIELPPLNLTHHHNLNLNSVLLLGLPWVHVIR